MKRRAIYGVATLLGMIMMMLMPPDIARSQGSSVAADPKIYVLEIDGAIGPATAEYVQQKFALARADNVRLIVLRMDTPGGLDIAMRDIIQEILASPIPVATFVSPQGARAASAGTYILYASHIAAMSPGTNLGAATPVQLQGPPTSLPGADDSAEENAPTENPLSGNKAAGSDAMTAKAINDASAYIESLADLRGRNVEWGISAVREAASLPAAKAVEMGVVDLMADNLPALIKALEGWEIAMADSTVTLALAGLPLVNQEPSWRTQLLQVITDPNIALILMMIGVYGLILEFYNPGAILPGLTGAICLLLALYALNVLPVNYAGLALMLLGMALIVAEAFVASFGILGLGGGVAFLLGATLLFDMDAPGFELSMPMLFGTAIIGGGLMILVMTMAVRAYRRPVSVGEETAVGAEVVIIDWLEGAGTVDYHGEHWNAHGPGHLTAGQHATVTERDGLTLTVAQTVAPAGLGATD
jgi:membrane-bound serine protease (ClpP class)